MTARAFRIAVVTIVVSVLFEVSRQVGEAQGNPPLPGLLVALGVLSFLFLIRAVASEASPRISDVQKDLQWGLGSGVVVTILYRLLDG